jgi:hypothetical protein
MRRVADDPTGAARTIRDCDDILGVIMQGDVAEWLGG